MKQTAKSRKQVLISKQARKRMVVAEGERIVPISNLPATTAMVPKLERDFVIQRFRREVSYLKAEIYRLSNVIRHDQDKIRDQIDMWELGLNYEVWPTLGIALTNLRKLKGALEYKGRFLDEELPKQAGRKNKR